MRPNRAVAIFNKLRLPDVIGAPALAEAGADWFREIVGALHGSFDPTARERMIREIFLLAPKKSSKTSYAAALMVTTLLMNQRPRAEFLLVAPTVSLAHIAFSQALGMVDKDPDGFLRKRLHVQEHLRKITDRRTKATLEIKAFDTTRADRREAHRRAARRTARDRQGIRRPSGSSASCAAGCCPIRKASWCSSPRSRTSRREERFGPS